MLTDDDDELLRDGMLTDDDDELLRDGILTEDDELLRDGAEKLRLDEDTEPRLGVDGVMARVDEWVERFGE